MPVVGRVSAGLVEAHRAEVPELSHLPRLPKLGQSLPHPGGTGVPKYIAEKCDGRRQSAPPYRPAGAVYAAGKLKLPPDRTCPGQNRKLGPRHLFPGKIEIIERNGSKEM